MIAYIGMNSHGSFLARCILQESSQLVGAPSRGSKRRFLERRNSEQHRSAATDIANPLADAAYLLHDMMATNMGDAHMRWVGNIRAFVESLKGEPLRVGTIFSGCDIIHVVMNVLSTFWAKMYNLKFTTEFLYMCEADAKKQEFLKRHIQPARLFSEAGALGELTAHCVIANERVPIPHVDIVAAGSELV